MTVHSKVKTLYGEHSLWRQGGQMAKVVVQLLNDTGEVENESILVEGVTLEEADLCFGEAAHPVDLAACPSELVVEFHYQDGSVGAHPAVQVGNLWAQFATNHEPSHIVIRPDTEQGQLLSNQLCASEKMADALNAFVKTINATGGVIADDFGFAPAGDQDWLDLGLAYAQACEALELEPSITN
jgi:hypothetical protein